jgi:hypothetical protein
MCPITRFQARRILAGTYPVCSKKTPRLPGANGGRLSATSLAKVSYAYLYDNVNRRTRVTREDGTYWTYGYNDRNEVTSGKRYWPDSTPVAGQQFEYDFDNIGNRNTAKAGGDAAIAFRALRVPLRSARPLGAGLDSRLQGLAGNLKDLRRLRVRGDHEQRHSDIARDRDEANCETQPAANYE